MIQENGKIYALFIDMKAAYDMVERKGMSRIGIRLDVVKPISDIYTESKSIVLIGRTVGRYWIQRGLRQVCSLSPTLFSVYIADIEEFMLKGRNGGIVVGRQNGVGIFG